LNSKYHDKSEITRFGPSEDPSQFNVNNISSDNGSEAEFNLDSDDQDECSAGLDQKMRSALQSKTERKVETMPSKTMGSLMKVGSGSNPAYLGSPRAGIESENCSHVSPVRTALPI